MKRTPTVYIILVMAATGPVAAEFQVNTETTYNQTDAAVAMAENGSFVVAWSSYKQDGDSGGVFARLFDPNCRPLGEEFQVNTRIAGNQTDPAVAMDPLGNFVVAWHGPGESRTDIFARRFDPSGVAWGPEFRVNALTEGTQQGARVAMGPAGAFVIAWETRVSTLEGDAWTVAARPYDPNGRAITGELRPAQQRNCRYPDVASDSRGGFVIVWLSDESTKSICARLYGPGGSTSGEPFEANNIAFGSQCRPAVAADYAGNFVVAWDGHPDLASLDDIHARLFKYDGTALGGQFRVNSITTLAQERPRVAMTGQGQFVVVWHGRSGVQANAKDVFARRFSGMGTPASPEIRLNRYTAGDQKYPAVAIAPTGRFIAAWQSYAQDGSHFGVFAGAGATTCPADFSGDGFVNFKDFPALARQWRTNENSPSADIRGDSDVDFADLAELCRGWLQPCQPCSGPP